MSSNDTTAPEWVCDIVSKHLGHKVRLQRHRWSVNRNIFYNETIIVRDAPKNNETESNALRELAAAHKIGLGLAQQPLMEEAISAEGRLLTIWERIPGLVGKNTPSEVNSIASMLHRLHYETSSEGFGATQNPIDMAIPWADSAPRYQEDIQSHLKTATALLREIGPPEHLCVIHGDPHGGNVIFNGAKGVFIDFESTGIGDPHWDLAVLVNCLKSNHGVSGNEAAEIILNRYNAQNIDPERISVLSYVRSATTLPVKAGAPGLANIDFSADISRMEKTREALSLRYQVG